MAEELHKMHEKEDANLADSMRERIEEARRDELEASSFYNQLAAIAPNPSLGQIISSIAGDEYGHARILATMLAERPLTTGLGEGVSVLRDEFRSGLERAIKGELSAISDYAQLAAMSPTTEQKLMFISILGDEYGHVRTFITMLSSLR